MTNSNRQVSVLFVCMGNICRSPTGEGVFQYYVKDKGYADLILVDSAGITSYHSGDPADFRMRNAAGRRGYQLNSIARQVTPGDIEKFDLIIAMDHDNLYDLQRIAGGRKPHLWLLGSFLKDAGDDMTAAAVPDPYYGGVDGFEEVLDMIESACPAILEHCLNLLAAK